MILKINFIELCARPKFSNLGPTELASEVKSLRKARALASSSGGASPFLEEVLAAATRSSRKFPSMFVLQQRYDAFAAVLGQQRHSRDDGEGSPLRQRPNATVPAAVSGIRLPQLDESAYDSLAQRIFRELESAGSCDGLLSTLFPITTCHQQLTTLSQQKVRCLNRARDFLEPEERKRLESKAEDLDRQITQIKARRRQAPPHALLVKSSLLKRT